MAQSTNTDRPGLRLEQASVSPQCSSSLCSPILTSIWSVFYRATKSLLHKETSSERWASGTCWSDLLSVSLVYRQFSWNDVTSTRNLRILDLPLTEVWLALLLIPMTLLMVLFEPLLCDSTFAWMIQSCMLRWHLFLLSERWWRQLRALPLRSSAAVTSRAQTAH